MSQANQEVTRKKPLPLEHWEERLERHFSALAATREGSGFPIFALEHPLSPAEIEDLSSLLRAQMRSNNRLGSRYWLCWVVYATEIGYGYTGDEYWQSFIEATPGWQLHHRDALRIRFRKFQKTYGGVKPTGAWSDHFPIIAWPITHAILPKYLQYQFADAIYQLRFRLAKIDGLDSASAGRMLASYSYNASTRFQQFLQQEELTGRILLSLLGISLESGPAPIFEPTLARIVADLDAVPKSRTRLREARTMVDRSKGIGRPGSFQKSSVTRNQNDATHTFPQPSIRPRVFLRHSGSGKWSVAVDVPSFAQIATFESGLGTFLKRTRCRILGAPDVKPAGWVLSHNRVSIIKSWPDASSSLIQFEESQPFIDRLLQSDCLLSVGSFWLFRIGSDGVAREIISRVVRPGYDYIVLSNTDAPEDSSMVSACVLDCADIKAYRLSIPVNVTSEETSFLSGLGIQVARTVRVWPAGLPCRGWDGEGQSEWLTTEEPCFGIVHDHPVSQYIVSLNDSVEEMLPAPAIGQPTFVRLQALPAGKHKLTITAKRDDSLTGIAQLSSHVGVAELTVREPEPWVPGTPSHIGLIVNIDPHDAELDEFWENKVVISVSGPSNHSVICAVSLERSNGEEIFKSELPRTLRLPISPETWRKNFETFTNKEEATNWRYPEAAVGRLHIQGGELGSYVTSFHRDVAPVRWVTRNTSAGLSIKLVDDTGLPDDAQCSSFSMLTPVALVSNDVPTLTEGLPSEPPGALYVARHGDHQDTIIVSHGLAGEGLQGLGVRPDVAEIIRGEVLLSQAVRALALWHLARLAGPLAEQRRSQVTRELSGAIFEKLCGRKWAESEHNFEKASKLEASAEALQHRIDSIGGFGAVLKRDYANFLVDFKQSSSWYFDLARRYQVSKDVKMCEFAVRLSFLPQTLSLVYGSDLDGLIKRAFSEQQAIRGARFAALLCARHLPNEYAQFVRRRRW